MILFNRRTKEVFVTEEHIGLIENVIRHIDCMPFINQFAVNLRRDYCGFTARGKSGCRLKMMDEEIPYLLETHKNIIEFE